MNTVAASTGSLVVFSITFPEIVMFCAEVVAIMNKNKRLEINFIKDKLVATNNQLIRQFIKLMLHIN